MRPDNQIITEPDQSKMTVEEHVEYIRTLFEEAALEFGSGPNDTSPIFAYDPVETVLNNPAYVSFLERSKDSQVEQHASAASREAD